MMTLVMDRMVVIFEVGVYSDGGGCGSGVLIGGMAVIVVVLVCSARIS